MLMPVRTRTVMMFPFLIEMLGRLKDAPTQNLGRYCSKLSGGAAYAEDSRNRGLKPLRGGRVGVQKLSEEKESPIPCKALKIRALEIV